MPASLLNVSAALQFKLDTGTVKDGKTVYRTVSLNNVDPTKTAEVFDINAKEIKKLFAVNVEAVSLRRTDMLIGA